MTYQAILFPLTGLNPGSAFHINVNIAIFVIFINIDALFPFLPSLDGPVVTPSAYRRKNIATPAIVTNAPMTSFTEIF